MSTKIVTKSSIYWTAFNQTEQKIELYIGNICYQKKTHSIWVKSLVTKKIEGMLTPSTFIPEVYKDAMAFKPGPDDVFVATYPKCGTTWVQQIVSLIFRKGKPLLTAEEYFATLPFLEMTPMEILSELEKPRCIKTHLPFDRINFSRDAKYICVARHPADCVVSFFHHTRFFPTYFFSDGCFDDFFELFIKGEVDWNDYFDHLLSWYEHKDESEHLVLTYEAMKSDPP
ncbi:sulfotransferase 1C2 [Caerostris extrusa]|uniref:Sulfotransferase 1C2 n=1 Tax=Caerostris extrusa TaxID=172846 RepID=A0AAV4MYU6_CAEEX|nr:sulfotransferase 1C2 [Caerostris extrusa]